MRLKSQTSRARIVVEKRAEAASQGVELSAAQEYDLKRSCKGKQNHADPMWALWACVDAHRRFGGSLFAYKCRYCPNYHLGHVNRQVRQFIQYLIGPSVEIEHPPFQRLTYNLGMLVGSPIVHRLVARKGAVNE